MEIKHGAQSDCSRGNEFPVAYLRLMAPPLQLFSAAMWQVVQQGLVDNYGMLEEFVTMVTELVPQLMSYSQRAQLILGLRARLVLELCRSTEPVDLQTIQPHLDRIKAPSSTANDPHVTVDQVEESEVNFVELVHTLLESPAEKAHFFQEVYPEHFGSKYDTALEMLVWEFISRLDELLPIPDFTQMVEWLVGVPSFLHDTLQSFRQREDMKVALEHHGNLEQFEEKDPSLLPMDDCILYSLALPTKTRMEVSSASHSPSQDVSLLPDVPNTPTSAEDRGRRSAERARLRRERREAVAGQIRAESESLDDSDAMCPPDASGPADAPPPTELSADDDVYISRGGRALRKRKMSRTPEPPAKQPSKRPPSHREPSLEVDSSGESPLISIWGEYTDPQAPSVPAEAAVENKAPWSDDETLRLLEIWGKDSVQRGLQGCIKNRHIFSLIAQRLAEHGHVRSVEQCQVRIKRLKKAYRHCLKRNRRKTTNKTECKFYEQLEGVLGGPSGGPKVTYDPEEEEEGEGDEEEEEQEEEELKQEEEDDEDLQILGCPSREVMGAEAPRSVPWTDAETQCLVNIWGKDQVQQGLKGVQRRGPVFPSIAQMMGALGYSRSAEQCQSRLKRLKSTFRQCYNNNLQGKRQVECKFYEQLGRVLTTDLSFSEALEESSDPLDPLDPPDQEDQEKPPHADLSAWHREMGAVERRKVPWSDKETVILLELWGDHHVQYSLRRSPHNGHVFTDISEKLGANGFYRSAGQCHTRVKRLKARYRQARENLRTSGTDKIDFKFYDLLEQIVEKQPSTSSLLLPDAATVSEESDGESANGADATASSKPSLWSDEETLALMAVWGEEEVQRALRGAVHNGHVYAEISERMRGRGHGKSQEQCRWKVKALRAHFRQCYDRKKRLKSKVEYKFYPQLEAILGQEVNDESELKEEEEEQETAAGANGASGASGPWSEPETVALVGLWASAEVQDSLRACVHNSHIYGELAGSMAELGYPRTAEGCQARIKNLKKTYRNFCNSRRSGGHPMLFTYYQLMEPVLGDSGAPPFDPTGGDGGALSLLDPEDDLLAEASPGGQAESSRKMPWSERETETLLAVWGEDGVQLTLTAGGRTRHLYDYISQKMRGLGFGRSPEQCCTRLKRLRAAFHHDKKDFKYFDQMEQIYNKVISVDEGDEDDGGLGEDPGLGEYPNDLMPDLPDLDQDLAALLPASDGTKQTWGEEETELLLELWGSDGIQEALRSSNKTKPALTQVSRAMAGAGFHRTPQQCQTRIKRLKRSFRRFVEDSRGGTEKQECKYFDQLLRVFGAQYVDADLLDADLLANAPLDLPGSPESSNGPSP
ncbi:uncharacterized protein zgc:113263 isoform X1 [Gadus chalcogrammus]|uniref:uncharacterized protein zgc:113263 isoform X1 n=1 Tax=Gadus chalcogrammus TaxID=1042646 RepID=UPI0024C42F6A|nr:uncharacterized protein zgc:113263 isoform X1 [Gadus chalcogrammus]